MTADETQTELHNRLSREIVTRIVRGVYDNGGGPTDLLVLTESILTGICLAVVKLGGDEPVLDHLVDGVRLRLAEIRLRETKGEA